MCVALIGGMERLEKNYITEAEKFGIDLRVCTKSQTGLGRKIRNVDALVIFTNKVSHRARNEAIHIAATMKIPILQYHSCGVCTLRACFSCITGDGEPKGERIASSTSRNIMTIKTPGT